MVLEIFCAYSDFMRNSKNHLEMRGGRIIMSLKEKFQFGGYSNGEISDVGNRTCNGNEVL